ncbi:uncharacterized protein UV8b_04150 [Ustilaginoidea virens]|uniref:Malate dehydrogenase n=1 Tax=Ustilaginoidea virens TaxID=1159556 RepID=A0A8E5HQP8_USTVR|nr:uncharacterized protein UV8b_04150 [Ustilaginoidea virens]QUC19909.1 hypothetical protein UV8b_04150 [Ustilaginoidea virens]
MRPATVIFALAVSVKAAPTSPHLALEANPVDALDNLSGYFNLVAVKVQAAKTLASAPSCDLSRARMPTLGLNALPSPDRGLTVRHVAVGRGTQNYTCEANNPEASPKAAGAMATLFNATCVAAVYPDILSRIPGMAVHFDLEESEKLGPTGMTKSGVHYFLDSSTPFFNLDTPAQDIGQVHAAKNSSSNAPSTAAVGQLHEKAVAWLRLTSKHGTTGDIKEVYRVDTAGGSAPASCKGMPSRFEVQYAAVYWFWQGSNSSS